MNLYWADESRIISDIPRWNGRWQTIKMIAAIILKMAATILLVIFTLLAVRSLLFFGKYFFDPTSVVRVDWDCIGIGRTITTPIVLYLLWLVAAGKKKTVLYLRRFKRQTANKILSLAMYGSLRASGRLVVLDDSQFEPIAIPIRERILTILPMIPFITVLALFITLTLSVSGTVDLESTNVKLKQTGCVSITTGTAWNSTEKDRTSYIPQSILTSFPQNIGVWFVLIMFGLIMFRALIGGWEARRNVSSAAQLRSLLRRMRLLGSWLMTPRLLGTLATVVNVDDSMWKTVVAELSSKAKAIVLDISYPTEAIKWELIHSIENFREKVVLIMDAQDNFLKNRDMVDPGTRQETMHLIQKSRLGGVVLYNLASHAEQRTFGRNLRNFVRGFTR